MIPSSIHPKQRRFQHEVGNRWVIIASACPDGFHPAGTMVCEHAPYEPFDSTFTAPNGKRYSDTEFGSKWTPATLSEKP